MRVGKSISITCTWIGGAVILVLLGILAAQSVPAADPVQQAVETPVEAQYGRLKKGVQKILEKERASLAQLENEIAQLPKLEAMMGKAIDNYKIRLSSDRNLLLLPGTRTTDLEKAWNEHQVNLTRIDEALDDFRQKLARVEELRAQAAEQYALNENQIRQIKAENVDTPESKALLKDLRTLLEVIEAKRKILDKLQAKYSAYIAELEDLRERLGGLFDKFDAEIKLRKKQELFERRGGPLAGLAVTALRNELLQLGRDMGRLMSWEFWSEALREVWKTGGFLLLSALFLYSLTLFFMLRIRRFCRQLREKPFCRDYPWRFLAMHMVNRSLPILGTVLFLHFYALTQNLYLTVSFLRSLMAILLTLLFTKWGRVFFHYWYREPKKERQISRGLIVRLRIFIGIVRYFAISYVILEWFLPDTSVLLVCVRIAFEISLLAWFAGFSSVFEEVARTTWAKDSKFFSRMLPYLMALGYTIFGVGPIVELAGYGSLALYWYTGWGLTAVVALWGSLFFLILREWDQHFYHGAGQAVEAPGRRAQPLRWFIFKISWILWTALFGAALIIAWGGWRAIVDSLMPVLRYSVTVGALKFSLQGVIYAILILFLVHVLTRIARYILEQKFLRQSGLEQGLQNSIISITVYLLWGLGVLAALHAFGLSTTSMAVAFGALGIGLGFGLQNIFNNFISGIILLFERPIQVGDSIEIGGLWAEVRKINVRATVVQTFDNASLIIPNSEFISRQVTNWSFRDQRLRIKIEVGVAYGSNIQLVEQTLLEIAGRADKVLKYPRPDVLFTAFGDSSLNFVLRIWTDVDNMLQVGSRVRFEIDRLFRERGIEIAFPQRDIHIRSIVKEARAETDHAKDFETRIQPIPLREN